MSLARLLGPAELGIYAVSVSAIAMLAVPVLSGLPTLLVRETAAAQANGQAARIDALIRWSARRILSGSILICAFVLLTLAVWSDAAEPYGTGVLWALPLVPILAFGQARAAILRGFGQLALGLLPESLVRPAILLLALGLLTVSGVQIAAPHALGCLIVAGLGAWAVGGWVLARQRPKSTPTAPDPTWTRSLWPLAIMAGLQSFNTNVDVVLLGWLAGAETAGIYRVAVTAATLGLFVVTTLKIILQPRIAHLWSLNRTAEMERLMSQAAIAATLVAAVCLGIVALWGAPLISLLFGSAYDAALTPLIWLLLGNLVLSVFAMSTVALTMSGHERGVVVGLGIAAALNLILNLLLIPSLGASGAAIATASAAAVGQGVLFVTVLRRMGIHASPLPALAPLNIWAARPAQFGRS